MRCPVCNHEMEDKHETTPRPMPDGTDRTVPDDDSVVDDCGHFLFRAVALHISWCNKPISCLNQRHYDDLPHPICASAVGYNNRVPVAFDHEASRRIAKEYGDRWAERFSDAHEPGSKRLRYEVLDGGIRRFYEPK